ncbi:MAG: hypothetical protein IJ733_20795, partial [Lachnospiraceae bacterium]|nr:hypothetical protein [Lachnospiraceae bacterium]
KMDFAIYPVDAEAEKLRRDKGTGAISKLACLNTKEDADICILYRTDYINATTFPVERNSIRQIFYEMGGLEVNE